MSVIHFSYDFEGGAGRAGRRASLACTQAGLSSSFISVKAGIQVTPGALKTTVLPEASATPNTQLGEVLKNLQWDFIPKHRTRLSNTLLSIPYPGLDFDDNRIFRTADIIHLHWPTWGVTPRAIRGWLKAGRSVFWTLHDCWPMTGGCHYPAGCNQYETACLKCPQLQGDNGLISNCFEEKLRSYGDHERLTIVTPSQWMADVARSSRIFRNNRIHVVRNAVELDVFTPREDRQDLRAAFGVGPDDLVLFFGSFDLVETRKGVKFLFEAIRELSAEGGFDEVHAAGGQVHLITIGQSNAIGAIDGIVPLHFGTISNDEVLGDVLSIADVVCVPSLEDNYPNLIVEAMACGTPCLGTAVGGIPEMISHGESGVLVPEGGSTAALKQGLRLFVETFFGSAAMREQCRRSAVDTNDPAAMGAALRQLYEAALGRPFGPQGAEIYTRMARAFSNSPVKADARPGQAFFGFPANLALLRENSGSEQLESLSVPSAEGVDGPKRIITVRTFHEHHSARSGPYQFLRFLPTDGYAATHMAVPLGAELAGSLAPLYKRGGAALGAQAFGEQANAWLAESEVLIRCLSEDIDIVHFIDGELGGWLMPSLPDAVFDGRRRPSVVTTFHQPPAILEGHINADLMRNYGGVIALCESQRRFLASYVADDRIFLVPHGIDTTFFRPRPDTPEAGEDAPIKLLLVGHWLRDIEAAFAAYDALRASDLRVDLTVVSPRSIKTGGRPIRLLSKLSDEELVEQYWRADIVFLPLIDATANNAVLEAMACGRSIVTTAVGGVAEAVGDGAAILARPGDVAALVAAVRALAENPGRRADMGRAGRRRAEELDWSVIGARHDEVYRAVMARTAGRA